jgi:hypothetical protein
LRHHTAMRMGSYSPAELGCQADVFSLMSLSISGQ